jgi:3-deoxy-D-manno-octulosonate 8-phosphate phosphatase (KDO 8-P phosphatase)
MNELLYNDIKIGNNYVRTQTKVDNLSKKIKEKCLKIKLVLSDVDGVITDGGMYYTESGEEFKKFNTRDGMGVELLQKNKIDTIFITKENSKISRARAKKLNSQIYFGIENKEKKLKEICKKLNVDPLNIAYIGDDVNDVSIMKLVGFSASPNDGVYEVKKIVNYICENKGGNGAFREFADLIIRNKYN